MKYAKYGTRVAQLAAGDLSVPHFEIIDSRGVVHLSPVPRAWTLPEHATMPYPIEVSGADPEVVGEWIKTHRKAEISIDQRGFWKTANTESFKAGASQVKVYEYDGLWGDIGSTDYEGTLSHGLAQVWALLYALGLHLGTAVGLGVETIVTIDRATKGVRKQIVAQWQVEEGLESFIEIVAGNDLDPEERDMSKDVHHWSVSCGPFWTLKTTRMNNYIRVSAWSN